MELGIAEPAVYAAQVSQREEDILETLSAGPSRLSFSPARPPADEAHEVSICVPLELPAAVGSFRKSFVHLRRQLLPVCAGKKPLLCGALVNNLRMRMQVDTRMAAPRRQVEASIDSARGLQPASAGVHCQAAPRVPAATAFAGQIAASCWLLLQALRLCLLVTVMACCRTAPEQGHAQLCEGARAGCRPSELRLPCSSRYLRLQAAGHAQLL